MRRYVQGLTSYRVLATMLSDKLERPISRITLNEWVLEVGGRAKTPLQVSAELAPPWWGGVLGVDGKEISVRGEDRPVIIAVDHPSQDIVHALVVPYESEEGYEQLIRESVTEAGYPLRGISADLAPGLVRAHENYFAQVPLQACRIHFDRRLDQLIPKAKGTEMAPLNAEVKAKIRNVLYAGSEAESRRHLDQLLSERGRYGEVAYPVIASLSRNFDRYMTHHHHQDFPADNNATENVVKQLAKKLRLMESVSTEESARRYIRLLVGCYRFKRFTDSTYAPRNGKAPLEIAGVDLAGKDWLQFLLSR